MAFDDDDVHLDVIMLLRLLDVIMLLRLCDDDHVHLELVLRSQALGFQKLFDVALDSVKEWEVHVRLRFRPQRQWTDLLLFIEGRKKNVSW